MTRSISSSPKQPTEEVLHRVVLLSSTGRHIPMISHASCQGLSLKLWLRSPSAACPNQSKVIPFCTEMIVIRIRIIPTMFYIYESIPPRALSLPFWPRLLSSQERLLPGHHTPEERSGTLTVGTLQHLMSCMQPCEEGNGMHPPTSSRSFFTSSWHLRSLQISGSWTGIEPGIPNTLYHIIMGPEYGSRLLLDTQPDTDDWTLNLT